MLCRAIAVALVSAAFPFAASLPAGDDAGEWTPLFDGRTLNGWKAGENAGSFSVRNGTIVCGGPRAHLFYAGGVQNATFRDFEFRVEVRTRPGANSGIYFHTEYQAGGWPARGYEVQVNNTYGGLGTYRELRKTGSLYGVRNVYVELAKDDVWFTIHVAVRGKRIQIRVDKQLVVDYTEPEHPVRTGSGKGRVLSRGTFALQCHDPGSEVSYRNLRVRPLAEVSAAERAAPPAPDALDAQITALHARGFPLIDFHVHLKGGLTLDEAVARSRSSGIGYGIAANCGLGFPVTDDRSLIRYVDSLKGLPIFKGMQAEGREWVKMFSADAVARFDYVFTDAMTFTDPDTGKRMRLWIPNEVEIRDKQAFMDMYVEKIEGILTREPIDIYVNPTYLPADIAREYDALWTEERMDRVIRAAVENGVAIEVNARYRLPSMKFIRRAKAAGVKFAFGTNNGNRDLGRLEYCLEVLRECRFRAKDMFLPRAPGQKPVERKGLPRDAR